jgi:hypothetical protein
MAKRRSRTVVGFGFDPEMSPHHFAVTRDGTGAVFLTERFVWGEATREEAEAVPTPKAILDGYHWERIAGQVAEVFNQRLRQDELKAGTWGRETLLAPYFGQELTLLAWAVEDADPTVIPMMLANWVGLAPEERWWLYTTINATSGHPEHGKDRGWRKAIKIAFAENPTGERPPAALLTDPPTQGPRPGTGGRKKKGTGPLGAEQGQLPMGEEKGR